MADVALTPTGFVSETLEAAREGYIPAAIGAGGAALGFVVLTPFLAPASVPMSLLGMALARRRANWSAFGLGGLGLVLASAALLQSGAFWVAFATAVSQIGPI